MKISQALDKIDERQLFVPAFQREYVWKRDHAKQLIDSLIKEYPTGTMLTWETDNPPHIKGDYEYDKKQGAIRILLDGQQRLTTLYMLIRGKIPPYYKKSEITHDTRGLYVNLETLELAYHSKNKIENDPRWQNITDMFQDRHRVLEIVELLEKRGEVNREQRNRIYDNMKAIDGILDRDFPEQTVPIRAKVQDAIDIFYKVNASGVSLTDAELALAQISGYWPEARDVFKDKLEELGKNGFVFKLDFIVYVLLGCLHNQGSDMKKLHGPENNEPLRAAWKRLDERTLDYVVNIMKSHAYVDHTREIGAVLALVPIIVYCYNKENENLSDIEIRKMVKWFYYSQAKSRYVSTVPQKLDRDIRIVNEEENPFDRLIAVIQEERRLEITPDEFEGRPASNPLFHLVRWYLKSRQAICLTTGFSIRHTMGKEYSLENDHIFPSSKLRDMGYNRDNRVKYSLAQELTNRAILTKKANRSKGNADAKDYLNSVQSQFPDALSLQCIPEDPELWKIENYEQFLQVRRKMLADNLNKFLEELTETAVLEVPVSLEELISGGEGQELEFKSSILWDFKEGKTNKGLKNVVIKTVAAFTNQDGGTLLIGVDDDGQAIGLENDYRALGDADRDRFEQHLYNILNDNFGEAFVSNNLTISYPEIDDIEICQIDVREYSKKPKIVELKDKNGQRQQKFYLRTGNVSRDVPMSEMQSYLEDQSTGRKATVISDNCELTTTQAAKILNLSPSFLIKLLDLGKIPYREVDGHHRISRDDVLSYKKSIEQREAILDELVSESQKLGLYDKHLDFDKS